MKWRIMRFWLAMPEQDRTLEKASELLAQEPQQPELSGYATSMRPFGLPESSGNLGSHGLC
jgi:hypothetical protein